MRARPVEERIGVLLRTGVAVAGAVLVLGFAAFFLHGSSQGGFLQADLLRHGTPPTLRELAHGDPVALLQLGILLLILTPILRVAATLVLFAAERDWIFVGITAGVLGILLLGLAGVGGCG